MNKKYELQICLGSSCFSRGNRELVQYIKDYLKKNHLDDRVIFKGARCLGHCANGPVMIINDTIIERIKMSDVDKLLDKEFGTLI